MLFKAFARVRKQRHDLRLILTGDQPWKNVRALATEAGVAAQVDFVGRQTEPELVRLYQGAEVFVLSSNQEGLGISVLEAMACGTPVVATRCGGPESVLVEGETGFMVPLNDDAAMAKRILQLLSDSTLTATMRENCVRLARDTFSRPVVEKILIQAFQDVYPGYFQV
jgi:glycosyltransferase involved in cell wall biosynthesis